MALLHATTASTNRARRRQPIPSVYTQMLNECVVVVQFSGILLVVGASIERIINCNQSTVSITVIITDWVDIYVYLCLLEYIC